MENQKPTLIVMVGVPGSGKDYQIENSEFLYADGEVKRKVVSRDLVRYEIVKESEEYFSHEKDVFEQYIFQISNALKKNRAVIANATQANYGSRKKLLHAIDEKFGRDYNIVMYCIICDYETADRRNKQREGRAVVPEKAMMEMFNNFAVPSFKEDDRIEKIIIECYGACSVMRRQKI